MPAARAWLLLAHPAQWALWGVTVREAALSDGDEHRAVRAGDRGTVRVVGGLTLPFEVTEAEPGTHWRWSVAGVPATSHRVAAVTDQSSRVGFGVPWPMAPYLAVCLVALRRLARLP